jgi:opacity protein-like surface antigen
MTSKLFLAAVALTSVQAISAQAQQRTTNTPPRAATAEPSWYIGVGGGNGRLAGSIGEGSFPTLSPATSSLAPDSSGTAVRAFAGFGLTPNWAIEVAYADLGRFGGYRTSTVSSDTGSYLWTVRGFGADLVGKLPFGAGFSGLARLGVARLHSRGVGTINGVNVPGYDPREGSKYALHYGVGLEYAVNRSIALRGEWEMYKRGTNTHVAAINSSEHDYQVLSASALWKF